MQPNNGIIKFEIMITDYYKVCNLNDFSPKLNEFKWLVRILKKIKNVSKECYCFPRDFIFITR